MGSGKVFHCNACGEEFSAMTGVGMVFPSIYEETVQDIRSGEYGEDWKKFFEEHPDGVVNCEKEPLICEECGVPKCEMNLSLYLPKEGRRIFRSIRLAMILRSSIYMRSTSINAISAVVHVMWLRAPKSSG